MVLKPVEAEWWLLKHQERIAPKPHEEPKAMTSQEAFSFDLISDGHRRSAKMCRDPIRGFEMSARGTMEQPITIQLQWSSRPGSGINVATS